jgi:NitT/TauT family transport system substrate-binding protein
MKKSWFAGVALAAFAFASAAHAETAVSIGFSGWTGFGPLTLAKEAGIFKKHGLDVTLNKIPQASRHLALASGDIQCAATTVETWIVWNAVGVKSKQIFQMDKSYGADGIAVRADVNFLLAFMLAKNGMTTKDVKVVNMEPGPAAQAFVAGQNDAAMTYEPYLSTVRAAPDKGKILATTLDYPAVTDTVGCTPAFLEKNPEAAKALADSYFEALDMIAADKDKAYEIMGKDVKQSGKEFGASAEYLRWQDKAANHKFFDGEFKEFTAEAADLLLQAGVIKSKPNLDDIVDTSFIK